MKKQLLAVAGVGILTFAMATTAFADNSPQYVEEAPRVPGTAVTAPVVEENAPRYIVEEATRRPDTIQTVYQTTQNTIESQLDVDPNLNNGGINDYGFMYDKNGNHISREEFQQKIEQGIKNGTINPEDREFFADMYDHCEDSGMMGRGRGC